MANENRGPEGQGSLMEGIVKDVERLLEQQFALLRSEFRQEIDRAKDGAVSLGAGAGMMAIGGILCTHAVVHGLHRSTGLPLWGCYGLVGGLLGAAGVQLVNTGAQKVSNLQLSPARVVDSIRENLAPLAQPAAAAGG